MEAKKCWAKEETLKKKAIICSHGSMTKLGLSDFVGGFIMEPIVSKPFFSYITRAILSFLHSFILKALTSNIVISESIHVSKQSFG